MAPGEDETIANFGPLPAAQLHRDTVVAAIAAFGPTALADQSGLSRQTVWAANRIKSQLSVKTRRKLQYAARRLKSDPALDERAILEAACAAITEGRITLRELARRLKQDPSNLAKIFAGKRGLPKQVAISIIRTLNGIYADGL